MNENKDENKKENKNEDKNENKNEDKNEDKKIEYSCDGELPIIDNIFISIHKKSQSFELPILKKRKIQDLLENCHESKFGLGKKHVLDKTYRNAHSLTSSDFSTNFNPYDYPELLENINNLFNCHCYLQLHKINIYQQNGFFKRHKDTPLKNLLGTLVVFMPSDFNGGELVILNKKFQYDQKNSIKYVAFFSDKDHEVLPVLDGVRITLTYHIFKSRKIACKNIEKNTISLLTSHNPTYNKLAYGCDNLAVSSLTLKGYDLKIFNWLEYHNFKPTVTSILDQDDEMIYWRFDDDYDEYEHDTKKYLIFTNPEIHTNCTSRDGFNCEKFDKANFKVEKKCKIIHKSNVQKIHINIQPDSYGNDPYHDDTVYHDYYIVYKNPHTYSFWYYCLNGGKIPNRSKIPNSLIKTIFLDYFVHV